MWRLAISIFRSGQIDRGRVGRHGRHGRQGPESAEHTRSSTRLPYPRGGRKIHPRALSIRCRHLDVGDEYRYFSRNVAGPPVRAQPVSTNRSVSGPVPTLFVCFTAQYAVKQTQNSHSISGNAVGRGEPPLRVLNGIHSGSRPAFLRRPPHTMNSSDFRVWRSPPPAPALRCVEAGRCLRASAPLGAGATDPPEEGSR
jgi:hypothetical protein